MQDTGAFPPAVPVFGFRLEMAFFLASRDIWLALDDSEHDSRSVRSLRYCRGELLTLLELETYHKQLFYWLLLRYPFAH